MNAIELPFVDLRRKLKRQIRSTLRLKYLVLLLLLVGLAAVVLLQGNYKSYQVFVHELLVSAVAAAVVSLILSLMHDFLTKREQILSSELETQQLLQGYSREVFLRAGIASMTDADFGSLMAALTSIEPRFIPELIKVTAGDGPFAGYILEQYFGPLWSKAHRLEKEWANVLLPAATHSDSRYVWRGTRRFGSAKSQGPFLVAVTDDSSIASWLQGSDAFDDVLVSGKLADDSALSANLPKVTLKSKGWNRAKTRRIEKVLQPRQLSEEELTARLPARGQRSLERAVVYEFLLPEAEDYEYSFEVNLSLMEPMFFVRTERLSWIKRITIDYSKIRDRLGPTVWHVSFIGGINGEVDHDGGSGTITAEITEVLLPGQGIALVWTARAVEPAGSAAAS